MFWKIERIVRYIAIGVSLVGVLYFGVAWGLLLRYTHSFWLIFAITIPLFIAVVPGILTALLLWGLTTREIPEEVEEKKELFIIVPAHNEEHQIGRTLASFLATDYPSDLLNIIVSLDGCTDGTKEIVQDFVKKHPQTISMIENASGDTRGKAAALNRGLNKIKHKKEALFMSVDADVLAQPNSLTVLSNKLLSDEKFVAVAGNIQITRGEKMKLIEKLQKWDFALSIFSSKMFESRLDSLSVAHGACSMFRLSNEIHYREGFVGEDILLTYSLLADEAAVVGYEPNAFFETHATPTLKKLYNQRKRWGRGWWENAFETKGILFRKRGLTLSMVKHFSFPKLLLWLYLFPCFGSLYFFSFHSKPDSICLDTVWSYLWNCHLFVYISSY